MGKLVGIVVLVLISALLAGCGGGGSDTLTKDEYQAQVTAAAKELAASFSEIGKEANSLTGDVSSLNDAKELFAKLSDVVAKGEDNLRSFADELNALSPPEDAKEANAKLADGLDKLADDFGSLATALDDGSISDIAALGTKLQNITTSEGGKLVQEAVKLLEKAGYNFDNLG